MSIEDKMIRRIVELKERAERAEKELERVQRRNAAMRDFLVYLKQYTDGNGIPEEMDSMEMVLSDNAGSSFVSRAELAPLIEVVAVMADACGPWDRVTMERMGKAALEHARGKGWC